MSQTVPDLPATNKHHQDELGKMIALEGKHFSSVQMAQDRHIHIAIPLCNRYHTRSVLLMRTRICLLSTAVAVLPVHCPGLDTSSLPQLRHLSRAHAAFGPGVQQVGSVFEPYLLGLKHAQCSWLCVYIFRRRLCP
jgi:hypothetical protein